MANEETLWAWLHLSDIHFGHGSAPYQADQKDLISQLIVDMADVLKRGDVPAPRAVLLTGDVGTTGGIKPATGNVEYETAAKFLKNLKKSLPGQPPFYAVPGNHDVQRTPLDKQNASELERTASDVLKGLRDATSIPSLDDAISDATKARILKDRFANYTKFCEAIGCPVGAGVDGLWGKRLSIDGPLGVHIIGLNTAFLSNNDSDRGVLNLPHGTVGEVFARVKAGDLVFVLTHHPTDWLNPGDVIHLNQKIRRYRSVHLHGHIHVPEIKQTNYGTGESVVTIAAGAVHADEGEHKTGTPHTYSFGGVIKLEDGSVVIRIWPRRWIPMRGTWNADSEQLPPTEDYVQYVLIRPVAKVPEAGIDFISELAKQVVKALPTWEKNRSVDIVLPIRSSSLLDAEPKRISPDFNLVDHYRDNFVDLSDQLASLVEGHGDPVEAADVSSQLRLLLEGVYQQRLTFDGENRDSTGSAVTPEEVFGELSVMPTATQIQITPRAMADVDQKLDNISLDTSATRSDGYIG